MEHNSEVLNCDSEKKVLIITQEIAEVLEAEHVRVPLRKSIVF